MDISHVTDHSSSKSRRPLYELFLSFSGPDMGGGFADFLYTMLIDVGIRVFRNKEELERSKEIDTQLIQVIERCKISIAIISEEYASSKSCLMELVQMVKCMDRKNHTIIPIFFLVKLSDVRHCSGPFERALDEHQKHALHRIAGLPGYHVHNRDEVAPGKVVKQIVHQVLQKLKEVDLNVPKQLVGVDSHVQGIMAKLMVDYRSGQEAEIGGTSVKVLGIYGIPGVGKTVLAKCVYNQLYHLFDACSFLGEIDAEIKHHGVLSVQNKLISDLHGRNPREFDSSDLALNYIQSIFSTMKILLLLDNVEHHEQLSALVGELHWLGSGSRIILTSRTQDVLRHISGGESFVLEPMKQEEALKLFCRHAFATDYPREEFETLSTGIVAATGGLPLALEVIGSTLFLVKSKKAWKETLAALEAAPHKSVQAAFFKTYTTLDENEQQIFLDIACFFNGMDKRIPSYMWDDCNYLPSRSILSLHARSLVEIGEDKELHMHKIIEKFGREIVKNENRNEPCKRSRLCNHEEALNVLERKEGTSIVEALVLEFGDGSKGNISFECDQFNGLENLRFLKLDRADIRGNFGDRLLSLRWLDWQVCHEIFDVQSLNLNLQNLVVLNLSGSQVDGGWNGWKPLLEARKLKVLKLTGCLQLITTPRFLASMELERLILEGCSNLEVIHPSFRNLEKLVSLNMKGCSRLRELPDLCPMGGLKELVVDGTSISQINFQGCIKKLKTLSARDCKNLTEISNSIGSLKQLKTLSLNNCRSLDNLPDGIGLLWSLQFLDLSGTAIHMLPTSVKHLKAMKVLRMRGTLIQEFPEAILNLEKLEEIDFSLCQSLKGQIPFNIRRLSSLAILKLSDTQISSLPEGISGLSRLRELHISKCSNLQSPPEGLPFSLIIRDD